MFIGYFHVYVYMDLSCKFTFRIVATNLRHRKQEAQQSRDEAMGNAIVALAGVISIVKSSQVNLILEWPM